MREVRENPLVVGIIVGVLLALLVLYYNRNTIETFVCEGFYDANPPSGPIWWS